MPSPQNERDPYYLPEFDAALPPVPIESQGPGSVEEESEDARGEDRSEGADVSQGSGRPFSPEMVLRLTLPGLPNDGHSEIPKEVRELFDWLEATRSYNEIRPLIVATLNTIETARAAGLGRESLIEIENIVLDSTSLIGTQYMASYVKHILRSDEFEGMLKERKVNRFSRLLFTRLAFPIVEVFAKRERRMLESDRDAMNKSHLICSVITALGLATVLGSGMALALYPQSQPVLMWVKLGGLVVCALGATHLIDLKNSIHRVAKTQQRFLNNLQSNLVRSIVQHHVNAMLEAQREAE